MRVDLTVAYGALRCQDKFQLPPGMSQPGVKDISVPLLNLTWCLFSLWQPQAAHPVLTADGFSCKLDLEPMFSTIQIDRNHLWAIIYMCPTCPRSE